MKNRYERSGSYLIKFDASYTATNFILIDQNIIDLIDDEGLPNYKVEYDTGGQPVIILIDDKSIIDLDSLNSLGTHYKLKKRDELKAYIKESWMESDRTVDQIRTQWNNLKSAASGWTTKGDVDTAFNTFVNWFNG